MLTREEQYEKASMALVHPLPPSADPFEPHFNFFLKRWDPFFRQINTSSWLIFGKVILTQLPLRETKEEPNDYVDHEGGFIYRIRELGDDEARPTTTTSIPDQGPVRPRRALYEGMHFEYLIGSAGSLKFMVAKTDAEHVNHHAREHENIEYVANRGPKHFQVPRVLYHTEFEGRYVILTEQVGTSVFDRPIPAKFLGKVLRQIAKAVGEMAQWEAPSVQGVNGKDIQFFIFKNVIQPIFQKGQRASGYAQKYLAEKGFNMSPCGFLNGHIKLSDIGLDKDFNLVGFNTWCECAFVPKGFITSYAIDRVDWVARPRRYEWEMPTIFEGLKRQGSARMFSNLLGQGLPDEMECFDEILLDENAFRATHRERWELDLPRGEIGFLFPDNDPSFRPEVWPGEWR